MRIPEVHLAEAFALPSAACDGELLHCGVFIQVKNLNTFSTPAECDRVSFEGLMKLKRFLLSSHLSNFTFTAPAGLSSASQRS